MLPILLTSMLVVAPLAAIKAAPQTEHSEHTAISATQLKAWYDENKPMSVIDARSAKYFEGTLLPNARWLPVESTEKEILAALPSKKSLIVVYCWSSTCPASGWLYDKLMAMGYNNVYEYHEGIQDWIKQGFPTTKQ